MKRQGCLMLASCHRANHDRANMRYLENAPPDPNIPYGESMHDMLTLSMWMSIVIGVALFFAGRHGNILWMKVWSLGLIVCSLLYLAGDFFDLV